MISDDQEEIDAITWRVDGKVSKIEHSSGSGKKNLSFDYDAMGRRIAKHVYDDSWALEKSTYYALDAQGNDMSVYEYVVDNSTSTVTYTQEEKYIYGSSRLGVLNESIYLFGSVTLTDDMSEQLHIIGQRTYELTNHLGNVLSVVSDKPIPVKDSIQLYNDDFSSTIISPLTSSPTITLSLSGNRLKADYDGTSWDGDILIVIPTVPGTTYTARCAIDRNGGGALYFYARDVVTWANLIMISIGPLHEYFIQFTATGTSTTIAVETYMTPARTFYIDDFTVHETTIAGYQADIRQSTDYSPFGVTLHGRNMKLNDPVSGNPVDNLRFGYQGSEADNEVKGEGNSYTTEFRQLDPRLGRWLTIDPKPEAGVSVYSSMDNNPIRYTDVLGVYTEKRAKRLAARAEKHGITANVVRSTILNDKGDLVADESKKNNFGVSFYQRNETNDGSYQMTQFSGKFRGFKEKHLEMDYESLLRDQPQEYKWDGRLGSS